MKRLARIIAFLVVVLGAGIFVYLLTKQKRRRERLEAEDEILVETLEEIYYPANINTDSNAVDYPEADSPETI